MGIGFFTPVKYDGHAATFGQKLTEAVDGYFNLGGRVAIVTGTTQNGSEEVVLQDEKSAWWQTTLKVASYATLISPLAMLIAKSALRSTHRYHEGPEHVCPFFPNFPPVIDPHGHVYYVKAPLTLVRASHPTDLKISVLYNQKFRPQNPIVPAPSEIRTDGPVSRYTWDVRTQLDGTLAMKKTDQRIKMIWWEATRHDAETRLDPTQAVCVKRSELKEFLRKTLQKMGVKDQELEAFTHYWSEMFQHDYDPENAPYVLVQLVPPSELKKFIPEMQIEGSEAAKFALSRFYFRFEPIARPLCGLSAETYLSNLKPIELGPDAVIDLGGELAAPAYGSVAPEWDGVEAFHASFIKEHIVV
jgi:hypothetical protein